MTTVIFPESKMVCIFICRGRWLYIICGIMTIISGCCGGPPILISPESAAGIKAGARTGLSTVVAGVLFCLATFFAPLFQGIPTAGDVFIFVPQQYLSIRFHNAAVLLKGLYNLTGCL